MRIPGHLRDKIVRLRFKDKESFSSIVKILKDQDEFKTYKTAVFKICKKFATTNQISDLPRSGRKFILSDVHYKYLDNKIKTDRDILPKQLLENFKERFGFTIGLNTLKRAAMRIDWIRKKTRYLKSR
jgi:hypothetical protein